MTGLSVRTLRYYDEIGLLKPSDYTEGHHRLYTEDDVTVLMKIVFLRELGFPLKKIKEHLEGETDWEAFLKAQYERLEREKKRIEHLMNGIETTDRTSTRLNSSHGKISYDVFCLKKTKINQTSRSWPPLCTR